MAFLNMEQQTWAFTFGILGTYSAPFFLDQLVSTSLHHQIFRAATHPDYN